MPTIKTSSPIEQCETWIESNPCPPNEDGAPRVAHWIYKASLAFKLRRLSTETARPLIEKHMTREPRPGEIEQAIPRAYEQEFNGNSSRTSEPKAEYDPAKLERIANRINFDVHPNGSRLDHLGVAGTGLQPDSCTRYERGERIWIGTTKDARRGELYVHGGDQEDFRCLDHLREGNEGVWFLSNPVTGEAAEGVGTVNEFYAKGESWRSEENVTSWRYLLIESDKATENLWLRMLVQAPLAISAIYTSGSRSIYTLVYCYIDF